VSLTDDYLAELGREFPRLRVVSKDHDALSIAIDRALRVLTFGSQDKYLTHYVTTLGSRIYVHTRWAERADEDRYIVLRHEAVHLRQFRRYGLLLMSFLYAVPFFPVGLAYGRARLEWEAYAETLRATAEVKGIAAARSPALKANIVRQFTSGAYAWMWPFPRTIARWVDVELGRIEARA
jgi:hypothetical protein